MRWGRTTTDDGSQGAGTTPEDSRPMDNGEATWLGREVTRLADENDRLRVALEDVTESLAWRYVVRSSRGLNPGERAAVDHALALLADDRESEAPPEVAGGACQARHPSAGVPAEPGDGHRLRLLK